MLTKRLPNGSRVTLLCQVAPPQTNSTAQLLGQLLPLLAQDETIRFRLVTQKKHGCFINSGWEEIQLGVRWQGTIGKILFSMHAFFYLLWDPGMLVVATSNPPFNLWILGFLAKLRKVEVRYWALDLYPEILIKTQKMAPKGVVSWVWSRLNRWAYNQQQRIQVIGLDMQNYLRQQGIHSSRLVFHPLWSLIPTTTKIRTFEAPLRLQYSGNMGLLSDLRPLIRKIAQDPRFQLTLIGDGIERKNLEQLCRELSCSNVSFSDFVPLTHLADSLQEDHVSVVSLRQNLQGLAVPCKLYGILAAGSPVLALVPKNSEVARVVNSYACGIVVDPEDSAGLSEALSLMIDHSDLLILWQKNAIKASSEFQIEKILPAMRALFSP